MNDDPQTPPLSADPSTPAPLRELLAAHHAHEPDAAQLERMAAAIGVPATSLSPTTSHSGRACSGFHAYC